MRTGTGDTVNSGEHPLLLSVQGLTIEFQLGSRIHRAVTDVRFDVRRGEVVGLVGESGSGKSVSIMSLLGLIPQPPGRIVAGSALFEGRDLLSLPTRELRKLRGRDIGTIFQDPMTSLNPVMTIGSQLSEALRTHDAGLTRRAARARGVELLASVGLPQAAERMSEYPHALSGGMRQRVMIAMSIANSPKLLLADEPTTALDVTTQAQVLETLDKARRETGAAMILVTHDLGMVAEVADRILVMYGGRIMEEGAARDVFGSPRHPYSANLLSSLPRLGERMEHMPVVPGAPANSADLPTGCVFHPRCSYSLDPDLCARAVPALTPMGEGRRVACHFAQELVGALSTIPADTVLEASGRDTEGFVGAGEVRHPSPSLLEVTDLAKHFFDRGKGLRLAGSEPLRAVDGVSFSIVPGGSLGLVGESGCGKSTLGRTLIRYLEPSRGRIVFAGQDVADLRPKDLRPMRRRMQIVFQDPFSSLNPRMSVREILLEPLRIHRQYDKRTADDTVIDLLSLVGLGADSSGRFPHQFSGGQRQRIAIARSLALGAEMLILDEAVSALDVSIQAQVINLLRDLQARLGLAYLFISHDLSVVRQLCDRVAVMYLGKIVEMGTTEQVIDNPANPYTQALLSAIPVPDLNNSPRKRIILTGDIPNPRHPPSGCRFHTRCWAADDRCASEEPRLRELEGDPTHLVACHYAESIKVNAAEASSAKHPVAEEHG